MSTVLDELKERLDSAKARLTLAQQGHQAATVELNAAAAEHNIWNAAVQIEMREEAKQLAAAQQNQIPMPLPTPTSERLQPAQNDNAETEMDSHTEPVNKTELVREQLRTHPMGMTTGDLWKALREPLSNRAYMYSILKRLRDKDEIGLKRGKYLLKTASVEVKKENESTLVQ